MTPSPLGRIAMRKVHDKYVAYFAAPDTMDGAVELLRAPYDAIASRPEMAQQFEQMAIAVMSAVAEKAIGRPIKIVGRVENPLDEAPGQA